MNNIIWGNKVSRGRSKKETGKFLRPREIRRMIVKKPLYGVMLTCKARYSHVLCQQKPGTKRRICANFSALDDGPSLNMKAKSPSLISLSISGDRYQFSSRVPHIGAEIIPKQSGIVEYWDHNIEI
jgi:hypothetical protein